MEFFDFAVSDLGVAVVDQLISRPNERPFMQLCPHESQCHLAHKLYSSDCRQAQPGSRECLGIGAHYFGKAPEPVEQFSDQCLHVGVRNC
jgi:hypothetical protein